MAVKYKMVMQVVPSDSKNDLLMDLMSTKAANKVKHSVVTLNSGPGDLSRYCDSVGIPILVLADNSSFVRKVFQVLASTRKFRPDIIYFQSFIPSLMGSIISLIPNRHYRTVAVRHHNRNHHIIKNKKAVLLDRFISIFVDQVVAVSKSVSETLILERCNERKIRIIENGLCSDRYDFPVRRLRNISRSNQISILAIGRLDWQKNFSLLLEVATGLNEIGIDFTINVLGDGNVGERDKWINETQVLGLENRINWLGWVRDVAWYFDNSDIFLHTAVDEACPLVHIEALFAGIPIVSTSNGGCKDVLDGFYQGISSNNPKEYIEAIVQIMNDYANFQKIAESYVLLAKERFNPEISAMSYFA